MKTVKINDSEYRTTITEDELKRAFSSPRSYYYFIKNLHSHLGIPFYDEEEWLDAVIELENKK